MNTETAKKASRLVEELESLNDFLELINTGPIETKLNINGSRYIHIDKARLKCFFEKEIVRVHSLIEKLN